MKNPYDLHIKDTLFEVYQTGFARIEMRKIYRWFGVDRITNRVWDQLNDQWEEIDELNGGHGWRLGFLTWKSAEFLTLVCLDPEGTSEEDSSFQPIEKKKAERAEKRQ